MPTRSKKTTTKTKKAKQPAPAVQPEVSKKISEEFRLDAVEKKALPQNQPTTVKPIKEFVPVSYAEENTNSHKKTLRALMYSVLFIWAAGIVMYYIYQPQQPQTPNLQPTPTISVNKPTLTPTVIPTVDIKQYTIAILNGSGRSGAAGDLKTQLESAGYNISYIGNSLKKQEKTTVFLSPEVNASALQLLTATIGDISETYTQPQLPAGETAQIVITVGAN